MHAIRVSQYGDPEVLTYEVMDRPHPGPDEVLIRVEAAGVNYLDINHCVGAYAVSLDLDRWPQCAAARAPFPGFRPRANPRCLPATSSRPMEPILRSIATQ